MIDFTQISARGLQLAGEQDPPRPVDFVVVAGGYTLVPLIGWWRTLTPSIGEGILRFMDTPTARGPAVWILDHDGQAVLLQALASQDAFQGWTEGRFDADVNRLPYRAALVGLASAFPEHRDGIDAWDAYVTTRPPVQAATRLRRHHATLRDVGLLPLYAADGTVVDMLAIDALGTAESAKGDPWLRAIASQWVLDYGPRVEPMEFLQWVASQCPHGAQYPGAPRAIRAEGSTKRIAADALAGIL